MDRSSGMRRQGKRVVIVDDSRTMQCALEQILSLRMGMEVVGLASDVESAAPLIRSLQPDLVTIDVRLPYISGRKLLEMLSDMPGLSKVIVSGQLSGRPGMVACLEQAGADACIDKTQLSQNPAAFCGRMLTVLAKRESARSAGGRTHERGSIAAVSRTLPPVVPYPIPSDEHARLAVLHNSGLANDALDARLDLLTEHLGTTTDFPICLLTFIDRDRQWIKSAYGFTRGSTPRAVAFCNHTLCSDDAFIVSNAATDPRFAGNPMVLGSPRIRTYVGCPIVSGAGVRLGAVCMIDTKPRSVTPSVVQSLRSMSRIATDMIESRNDGFARAA